MDPLTIYAGAQATIAGIKGAIAMGKDINNLIGEVSKFYHLADQVHVAGALQIAWASKKLREDERYLKDMLIWSGNDDVYYEMIAERTRMAKERADAEKLEEERIQRQRETVGELVMNTLLFIAGIAVIVPVLGIVWHVIVNRGL